MLQNFRGHRSNLVRNIDKGHTLFEFRKKTPPYLYTLSKTAFQKLIYSRDPNKNTCAQTFFWKKVPPVQPFMGPVRLEKFGSKKI